MALWHFAQPATFCAGRLRELSLVVPAAVLGRVRDLRAGPRALDGAIPALRVLVGYLLRRRSTITEVAHRWGFSDGSHFTRLFRERHGVTPREFLGAPGDRDPVKLASAPWTA